MEPNTQVVSKLSDPHQAYNRTLSKITAVDPEDVEPMLVDVGSLYTQGSGPVMRARQYQQQVLTLPSIDAEAIKNLEDYWLATVHAQMLYRVATSPPASVPALYQKLLERREIMGANAKVLTMHGFIPQEKTEHLSGPVSHATAAVDVLGFGSVFREHWDVIAGKTAMEMSFIEESEALAHQLATAVGERAISGADVGAATLNRRRAFTLFARAYEETRQAIAFLRRKENDVDEIMPPLHTLRAPRRVTEKDGDEPATDTPAEGPVSSTPSSGAPTVNLPVGHPDSSPFIS